MRQTLLFVILGASSCLPNPQSVKERRETFDRGSLRGRLILDAPPMGMHEVNAVLGGRIKLMGYTSEPASPVRGDTVTIKLYWTPLGGISEDYQVFVHGDAAGGQARRIHGDHYPADGKYPTDVWREGEIIVDPFTVSIPTDFGAPQLEIFLGMYLGDYRVPMTDRGAAPADNENRIKPVTFSFQ